jgi:predicted XRE-type DNA-binding protein
MPRTKAPARPAITDQLREIIRASGLTQAQVAKLSGVPQPRISEFLRGGSMHSPNLDRLARFFDLELRPR